MATTKDYFEYIYEELSRAIDIGYRRMMGEYVIYYRGVVVGMVCDNRLLLKKTPTSERLLGDLEEDYPYKGSKTLMYIVDEVGDEDIMCEAIEGIARELPQNSK